MRKNYFYIFLFIIGMFLNISIVNASDNGDFFPVENEEALEKCLNEESICRLISDISLSSRKSISGDVILDLNGHSIVADDSLKLTAGFILINRGGKLTIVDQTGTGKISTGPSGSVWAAIQLLNSKEGSDYAELVVNGGIIEGYYYGITGNGTLHNSKLTINGGTIKGLNTEDSVGIYQPQDGEVTINGGNISGGTGIEIRSGSLTVHNGDIKGIAPKFVKTANKSGSTTNGVGIAIAQHTTKKAINVVVNGGKVSGQYALYEWNPHNNSQEDLNKINLRIIGGEFTSLAENGKTIYSQDFTSFVSGGKFTPKLTEYLTDDANVASKDENDNEVLEGNIKDKSSKNGDLTKLAIVVLVVGAVGTTGVIYYKKGK